MSRLAPKPSGNRFVPIEEFEKVIGKINSLMFGVIIVLLVGFTAAILSVIGPILDTYRFKAETYQDLVNKIDSQSIKIDLLLSDP